MILKAKNLLFVLKSILYVAIIIINIYISFYFSNDYLK